MKPEEVNHYCLVVKSPTKTERVYICALSIKEAYSLASHILGENDIILSISQTHKVYV